MNRSRLTAVLGLTLLVWAWPAFAEDAPSSVAESCTAFCRMWRSVSGPASAQAPATAPPPYVMQIPPEEVEPPVPSKIVAARGVVMAETATERAKRKRDYAAMLKAIVPAAARAPQAAASAPAPR